MIWTFRENIRNTTLFGRIAATEFRDICYFGVDSRNWIKVKIDAIWRIFSSCASVQIPKPSHRTRQKETQFPSIY
jgi:hypothetical protein